MSDQNGTPQDLSILDGGPRVARLERADGEDLALAAARIVADHPLGDQVDIAMHGRSSPRIWLLVHEPGEGASSAVAALAFARTLAERDQAALILDCDDRGLALTRWAGRQDADGWIDLVRYGASVLTCGEPLPFSGRTPYFLGVGSYTPADVTVQEIESLLARLRRQADDLILVCSTGDLGLLWAPSADIRLLCGPRAAGTVDRVAEFTRAGCPLTGRVAFGPEQEQPTEADLVEPFVGPEDQSQEADSDEVAAAVDRLGEAAPEAPEPPVPAPEPEAEFARRKGTSGVFRLFAGAGLLLIVLAVGYYLKFVREPSVPMAETPSTAASTPPPVAEAEMPEAQPVVVDLAVDSTSTLAAAGDTMVGSDVGSDSELQGELVSAATDTEIAPPPVMFDDRGETFAMDQYLIPVGEDGWVLHVYSFPDSAGAAEQVRILLSRGFRTAERIVEIKGRGRWYRVYLGSFQSKTEALAAKDPLLEELDEDWANPARF